ncbi:MAG: ribosome silencing factor [Hyphomicrobiaceae bacterium]
MPTPIETAASGEPRPAETLDNSKSAELFRLVLDCLDDAKAENIVTIDLAGKTSIGDYMIVASGRSDHPVGAIADQLGRKLKESGFGRMKIEGMPSCDWVLVDIGDVIVHIFRPEVREFYNLEKMWLAPPVADAQGSDTAKG